MDIVPSQTTSSIRNFPPCPENFSRHPQITHPLMTPLYSAISVPIDESMPSCMGCRVTSTKGMELCRPQCDTLEDHKVTLLRV
eukprot:scaffold59608_cov55-Attheya_sp.AAC.3